jgi:hypothetical protein
LRLVSFLAIFCVCAEEVLEGRIVQPLQAMGPHVAPLGLRFYKWDKDAPAAFPKSWDRALFIVQRGSWNRRQPIGQRVMSLRVNPMTGVTSNYSTFVMGWLKRNATENSESWGKPILLLLLLLVPIAQMTASRFLQLHLVTNSMSHAQACLQTCSTGTALCSSKVLEVHLSGDPLLVCYFVT